MSPTVYSQQVQGLSGARGHRWPEALGPSDMDPSAISRVQAHIRGRFWDLGRPIAQQQKGSIHPTMEDANGVTSPSH